MAKKRTAETEGTSPSNPASNGSEEHPSASPPVTPQPDQYAEGQSEEKRPTYRVGPILTDRTSAVETAVWASEVKLPDGTPFTVHQVTIRSLNRDAEGQWKPSKGFRGSQLYALVFCLQRCSDFILSQRDPANDCPF